MREPGGSKLFCFPTLLALLGVYMSLSVLLMVSFFLGVLFSKRLFQVGILQLSNCNLELALIFKFTCCLPLYDALKNSLSNIHF